LADPALESRWRECLVVMSGRIADMRAKLRSALEARTARDWFVHCVDIELLDVVEVPRHRRDGVCSMA
jgi:aspartate/tyrosine/aromatic aminotransferase